MTMKKLIVVMMLVTVSVAAMAQENAPARQRPAQVPPPGQQPARMMAGGGMDVQDGMLLRIMEAPRVAEMLGLTDEQKAELKEIDARFEGTLTELRQKQEAATRKQAEALRDAEASEEAVLKAVEELWAVRTEQAKVQVRKLLAVRAKLTAEQLAKVRQASPETRQPPTRPQQPPARPAPVQQ